MSISQNNSTNTEIILNPDKNHVATVREALRRNDGYCPCSVERDEDHRCICKEFREKKSGVCHCGLYFKRKKREE